MIWPTAELGELCTKIGSGATPSGGNKSYKTNGISLVRSMNVHMGRFKPDDLAFIDESQAAKLNNVILEADDVLLNITGASVARVCTLDNSVLPARVNQHVCILRPKRDTLHYQYLMRFLTSEQTQRKLSRIAGAGATREAITKTEIQKFQIPLPPLAEQKRIAGILDAADALRAKRREALAQLDNLLQSTFLDMFGDPVTNPMGWPTVPLAGLGKLDRGVSRHRPRNEPSLLGGPYPLVQTGDVANSGGYIRSYSSTYSENGLAQSKMWPQGTLCITIAANIANTGILTFDSCFPDSVVGFRCDLPGMAEYVQGLFWFFQRILDRQATQVAQKNINLKTLRELLVPEPPSNLRERFFAIVESVERQKARMRAHLAELDALFASLQSRAFNGEL